MTNVPTVQTAGTEVTWRYVLPANYADVTELFNSPSFASAVGTASNIQTDPTLYCTGTTLTDIFNCNLLDALTGGVPSPVSKYVSGIDSAAEPVRLTHSAGGDNITFQFPAMRYVDSTSAPSLGVYEYCSINVLEVFLSTRREYRKPSQ